MVSRCTCGWPKVFVDEINVNPKNDLREIVHWINIDLLEHLLIFYPTFEVLKKTIDV